MKKMLNTLYITRQESYLHKERETIVVKQGDDKLGQFPSLSVGNILCFGRVSVSPFLMGYCAEQGIGLAFYTEYGRFLARVQGKQTGNVLLRRTQYRWADNPEKSVGIARLMVAAKVANGRSVLQREIRNHGENPLLAQAIDRLAISLRNVKQACSTEECMGIEGEAAATYFAVFNELLRGSGFLFGGRIRRPPTDPVNALLSFVYSLVTQECISALQGVGLDPYVGFLHRDRPGRASLALDLLEEFRSSWADRFVLTLINRRQVQLSDFITESSGAVRLRDDARKALLVAYQERKQSEVTHPYLEELVPVGLLPHCQAMLLARHLRGDTEFYTPYLVK
ncbi:type I-C CRISPR-associated endonuclease Cas1c [Cellvibrio japonicus]|uniref:CRISPR-associated endonuclease Cas1 n=1 Tax=Cellvibrio japonicus (strain Ueda107) TaxID=498211 RepID=B3PKI4_CELJU|nr:type I-C CRISPR-associated endonuclease Cas1c [Cellvibrio japonicus]ACE83048.1 CRISPR-associated protein Cas1 [Cellvibrio japonicus Ueda107]QEI12848.1 type I-C CRISPR-associated endonuclease Cas1 [Cellvibrio japonicus]QEI16422.1 type I-C CRISPR-associated endonuclease Cas1 [Cellvibrio japonicus]QEI20000.1 type I-C CRISPR-associated endonuclease Cas1 [Cellvibrio japonicus]